VAPTAFDFFIGEDGCEPIGDRAAPTRKNGVVDECRPYTCDCCLMLQASWRNAARSNRLLLRRGCTGTKARRRFPLFNAETIWPACWRRSRSIDELNGAGSGRSSPAADRDVEIKKIVARKRRALRRHDGFVQS